MNKLKETLETLLSTPSTLYETLSHLCELAPLTHNMLRKVSVELSAKPKKQGDRVLPHFAHQLLRQLSAPPPTPTPRTLSMSINSALNFLSQLEYLLKDIELMSSLNFAQISLPDQFRRTITLEATRVWIEEAKQSQDQRLLDILAHTSERLGDRVLMTPETWWSEGFSQLLEDLSELEGPVVYELSPERLTVDEFSKWTQWPILFERLKRGVGRREVRFEEGVLSRRLRGKYAFAESYEILSVAERVMGTGVPCPMVYCPPGEFLMGRDLPVGQPNESPQHRVRLSRGFWIGQTPVTQALWESAMKRNPSCVKGPLLPVEGVDWIDAVRFCNALSDLEGLSHVYRIEPLKDGHQVHLSLNANGYRLPTESEWEYAAKAGTSDCVFSGSNNLDDVGWFRENSQNTLQPVAKKQPNNWGIYDMSGGIWEWCNDKYGMKTYLRRKKDADGVVIDPLDYLEFNHNHVSRGGCYSYELTYCNVTRRYSKEKNGRSNMGLRVVRSDEGL